MCLFVSECQRLHGIIEGVIRANETTSTPSKIITSSVDNLTVWYGERDPISHRLHLFGDPCHYPDYSYTTFTIMNPQSRCSYYFCRIAIPFAYDMRDPETSSNPVFDDAAFKINCLSGPEWWLASNLSGDDRAGVQPFAVLGIFPAFP